jgi:S1-C subfamily serine protease
LQIDARPSDAMALALKMNAPVFVSSQVFAKSKSVPAPKRAEETQLKLGVQAQDLTPELAAIFDVGVTSGIVVAVVDAGSPAAVAGIQRGDIITKANDTTIKTTTDLEELIQTLKAPAKITLEIMKKGKPVVVQIDLPS